MKIKNLLTTGILLWTGMSVAQNHCANFEWASSTESSYYGQSRAIATDAQGNSYVTGRFNGILTFGNFTLTSTNNFNIFIAKLDASGNYVWAKSAGGNGADDSNGIAVDAQGSIYITGKFTGVATFGNTTVSNVGAVSIDVFVAKLDASGNFLWANSASGSWDEVGNSIAVDSQGNSYITGYFYGTPTFGNTSLTSVGDYDVFIAKLDESGNFQWAKSAGGNSNDISNSIAIDSQGNSYITGSFKGNATFGNTTLTISGNEDAFVTKLDGSGNFLWSKGTGGNASKTSKSIALDSQDNSYVTGNFWGTAIFGSTTLIGNGQNDIFIAKLDAFGNYLWAKSASGISDDRSYSIAVDLQGNSYITGGFSGIVNFGNTSLTNGGATALFIAKLDDSGNYLWAKSAVNLNNGVAQGYGITIDSQGRGYITGEFTRTTTFDNTTLINDEQDNLFVTKFSECDELNIIVNDTPDKIRIFPNPVQTQLTVSANDNQLVAIHIMDLNGKILSKQTVFGNFTEIEVGNLNSGIYLMKIKTERGTVIKRFIKE